MLASQEIDYLIGSQPLEFDFLCQPATLGGRFKVDLDLGEFLQQIVELLLIQSQESSAFRSCNRRAAQVAEYQGLLAKEIAWPQDVQYPISFFYLARDARMSFLNDVKEVWLISLTDDNRTWFQGNRSETGRDLDQLVWLQPLKKAFAPQQGYNLS
jgi:hypothetical protein